MTETDPFLALDRAAAQWLAQARTRLLRLSPETDETEDDE